MALDDESNGKVKFGAKSEFVRSLDRSIPAAQVVALAEARGMKVSAGFVYNIRSLAGAKPRRSAALQSKRTRPTISGPEAVLRAAIAQLGLERARAILDEVEETFAGG